MQCLSCVNAVPKLCEIVDLSKEIRTHNEVILEHIWLCEAIDLSKEIKAHNEVVLEYIWLCETRVPGELQKDQHSVPNELPSVPNELPSVLDQFTSVFENSSQLPPSRIIDHVIPLLPNSKAVNLGL
jgi:hypothetical protein